VLPQRLLRKAAFARAYPILPEDLFPMYLTGSISSKVGPAVTRIFLPEKSLFSPAKVISAASIIL
jgi:hypothetical protein